MKILAIATVGNVTVFAQIGAVDLFAPVKSEVRQGVSPDSSADLGMT